MALINQQYSGVKKLTSRSISLITNPRAGALNPTRIVAAVIIVLVVVVAIFIGIKSYKKIKAESLPPEDQIKDIVSKKKKVNRVITFSHMGEKYKVRFVFAPNGLSRGGFVMASPAYVIAPEKRIPDELMDKIKNLLPPEGSKMINNGGQINGVSGFKYYANT